MKQAPQGPDNLSNGVLLYFKSTSPNEFVFAHIVQGGGSGHLRCPQDVVHRTLVSVLLNLWGTDIPPGSHCLLHRASWHSPR